jgi:hypothetical protein
MPRRRALDVVLVALGLALILALTIAQEEQASSTPRSVYSTYDFGRNGYAALYELLRRESVIAGQFERPVSLLDAQVRTLVISGHAPGEVSTGEFTRGDADALIGWVKSGGRLVLLGSPAAVDDTRLAYPALTRLREPLHDARPVASVPQLARVHRVDGTFRDAFTLSKKRHTMPELLAKGRVVALAYRLGRGEIVAIPNATLFANAQLMRAGNARYAYAVLGIGPVAFDERVHGYAQDRSFWSALPQPVHTAIVLAVALVVLALVGGNIRFAPALVPDPADERDSSAYIESMARLLMRGRAARRAVAECVDAVLRGLRVRTGLGPKATAAEIAERIDRAGWREGVLELDRLRRLQRPADADLIRAGRLSAQLRKDME